jgi:FkbM family methyltransferase
MDESRLPLRLTVSQSEGVHVFAHLKNQASRLLTRRRYAPSIEVQRSPNLIRLGSDYGGWTFEPSLDLQDSVVVSCGLGEDASFDVEFTSRFGAKVIILDPTPRAIHHFEAIQERIGQPALQNYLKGGNQPIFSYDLSKVAKGSLILEPSALWVENTKLRFFAPTNPAHVSHSIVNYQNNYQKNTSNIEVASTTVETVLAKYRLKTVPLMKLDIEGAEIMVIRDMMEKTIRPRQLLVEFDEMNCPSYRSKQNAEDTDKILRQSGYVCRYFDGRANFLYTHSNADAISFNAV